jgi:hypothetical protein
VNDSECISSDHHEAIHDPCCYVCFEVNAFHAGTLNYQFDVFSSCLSINH